MPIRDVLLPEYEHEMAQTRKALARVPMERASWKPHEKSMALGYLASHIADMPQWMVHTVEQDELDMVPEKGKPYTVPTHETRDELLEAFDRNVAAGRAALETLEDAALPQIWTLKLEGEIVFKQPRIVVLRSMVMNHIVHHRGQLSVYLRLLGVPVPALYGPSADERN